MAHMYVCRAACKISSGILNIIDYIRIAIMLLSKIRENVQTVLLLSLAHGMDYN